MRRFLTIFPNAENVHLIKDVGMIPFVLQKHFGYDSTLASYQNGNYQESENDLPALKQRFIRHVLGNELLDVLFFLLSNADKYDVLNVYHLTRNSLAFAILFKIITFNRGKVYLKLDADDRLFNFQPKGIKAKVFKKIFSRMNLISVESIAYAKYLNDSGIMGQAVAVLPNGFYASDADNPIPFSQKENLMITVGRIGTEQKATDILCDAFAQFAQGDSSWKLEVIGPIDQKFSAYIQQLSTNQPHLLNRITFVGEVMNRQALYDYYRRAKIFILSSRWEGFPIVLPEAIYHGCYVVSADLPAARDVTANCKYGALFPVDDVKCLTEILVQICKDHHKLATNCQEVQIFAVENFSWVKICKQITHLLG